MERILVLRGGALGDFIVTLPTLAALHERWPSAQIELVGNATAAQLAIEDGLLHRVHSQHDARWLPLFVEEPLPSDLADWLHGFDLILTYWPDGDGTIARHLAKHGKRVLTGAAMPAIAPAARHYLAALAPLGVVGASPQYWLRRAFPTSPRVPSRIAVHPGSGSPRKNWPRAHWLELLSRLEADVSIIVGEAEREAWTGGALAASRLAPLLEAGTLRICSGLSLSQLADELHACELFIGHDSGVSHLAAACGTACVLLFGPTDPAVWAPPASHVRILHRPDMTQISIEEVLHLIARVRGERT